MKKYIISLFVLFICNTVVYAQNQPDPEITGQELQEHVEFLASDALQGRKAGTGYAEKAADYIRGQLKNAGLKLLGENGYQTYDLVIDVRAGDNNLLSTETNGYVFEEDFIPYPFSQNARLEAGVVFAGYGFEIDNEQLQWNDYQNLKAENKWVMILRGDPQPDNDESAFINFSGIRNKVLTAKDHGAAGVLVVSGPIFSEEDKLITLYYDKTQSNAGIPVINISRKVADDLLAGEGKTIAELEKSINDNMQPASFSTDAMLDATTNLILKKVVDHNVAAVLEGNDPVLKDHFVVIGAHYDHLGMGGPGSSSRIQDTTGIHNGADDNASGVAGILEIAGKIAANNDSKRSLVVIAFGAEEMGLIGSKYFTAHPLVELKKIDAMINFDMIGRLDTASRSVSVSGTGTARESEGLLDELKETYDLALSYSPEGYGPSDHAAFYAEEIPVFFISTGAHEDYHTPADDADRLNFAGQEQVSEFACALVENLLNRSEALTFQEAGPKRQVGYRNRLKVTFGIMPDFTSDSNEGLGVGGVTNGKPADRAGMEKGDVIVAINGKSVGNIYDYMNRLKKLEPGQVVNVDVMREGKKKVLILQL
ncbi:MAG: M20/M25/M40 family metallo-hydrolase [Bacteroidota bacterium]|nr:M20/M25/M40 family metallo-hydrolase [Bacteroidota bacterium]